MSEQRFSFQSMRMGAGIPAGGEGGWKRGLLLHFTIFGVAFAITCVYHGMRGVMRLGGMVASGGPYAIEHPAPTWVWIMPVAIVFGMVCFFINLFSGGSDQVNLMPLAWPGLFLSGGWNFLEFTFHPPAGGLAWGWLVCGVVFVLMGGLPLLLVLKSAREKIRARLQNNEGLGPYVKQWLLIGLGVYLAIVFFRSVAG